MSEVGEERRRGGEGGWVQELGNGRRGEERYQRYVGDSLLEYGTFMGKEQVVTVNAYPMLLDEGRTEVD